MGLTSKLHEIAQTKSSGNENYPSDVLKLLPISTFENFQEVEEKLSNEIIKNQMVIKIFSGFVYLSRIAFKANILLFLKKKGISKKVFIFTCIEL
jgi:hypothetical protein